MATATPAADRNICQCLGRVDIVGGTALLQGGKAWQLQKTSYPF